MIYIVGKRGSRSVFIISKETGIKRYDKCKTHIDPILVNYGLAGQRLEVFYHRFKKARGLPTLNRNIGFSKLSVVKRVGESGILVPESKPKLTRTDNPKDYIEKRINSIGGIGIVKATGRSPINGKYYQKFLSNRLYELRVHAFRWTDDWAVQKRIGDKEAIAWNFKQGGKFITVYNPNRYKVFKEAKETSEKILNLLGMSFGAVDFVVTVAHELYFLEVNSSPGFTELSQDIYIGAFNKLKDLPEKTIIQYTLEAPHGERCKASIKKC